jgi:hypothetical protein
VSTAIRVLASNTVSPSEIIEVLDAPTAGDEFAKIAVIDLKTTQGSTLVSYRLSLASSEVKKASSSAKKPALNPKALRLMITEKLAEITYEE